MRVDLYSINADGSESIERLNTTIEQCFPDDPEEAARIEAELREKGETYYGGGAAPLFKFTL